MPRWAGGVGCGATPAFRFTITYTEYRPLSETSVDQVIITGETAIVNDDKTFLTPTDDEVVDRFAGVTVWQANGQRAPHKLSSA